MRHAKVWATAELGGPGVTWGDVAKAAERMDALDRAARAIGALPGETRDGNYWQMGVRLPLESAAKMLDLLALRFGQTEWTVDVAGQGDYERLLGMLGHPEALGNVDFDEAGVA